MESRRYQILAFAMALTTALALGCGGGKKGGNPPICTTNGAWGDFEAGQFTDSRKMILMK